MAAIYEEIAIGRSQDFVWDAVRDVGAIHKRLVPGFVVDCVLDGDARIVTFGNGMVVRELIVDVNDETRRHSWATHDAPFVHYNGSVQVFACGAGECRVVWIADLLPNELASTVAQAIHQGLRVMKHTLEGQPIAQ